MLGCHGTKPRLDQHLDRVGTAISSMPTRSCATPSGRRPGALHPHALRDHDGYAAKARPRSRDGLRLDSLHEAFDPRRAVEKAEAIFCGGGNTFRLLKASGRSESCRSSVGAWRGMVYSGASAGSNLACPTIRTTNDMPIVSRPPSKALELVSFQINPHYSTPSPGRPHGRDPGDPYREFLEENETPVVGLREGPSCGSRGPPSGSRASRRAGLPRGQEPVEVSPWPRSVRCWVTPRSVARLSQPADGFGGNEALLELLEPMAVAAGLAWAG